MKTFRRIFSALLIGGVFTATCVVTQISNDSSADPIEIRAADGLSHALNSVSDVGIEPPKEALFTAVNTLSESGDETEMDAAAETQAEVGADGIATLSHSELMIEANRIMSDLYADGLLTKSVGYACAFADTSLDTHTAKAILEQFRRMHHLHLALVKSLFTSVEQDSLTTRGWSEIRMDLVKLRKTAVDFRNETALVAR